MTVLLNSMGSMTYSAPKGFRSITLRLMYQDEVALRSIMSEVKDDAILVLEGGADISPTLYGEEVKPYTYASPSRDDHESLCYKIAQELGIPFIGNCRGHQLVAALNGGSLYQDLAREYKGHHPGMHRISITPEGVALGFAKLMESNPSGRPDVVNSLHHQGVKRVPDNGVVVAYAHDMLPEAIMYENGITFQWHPEFLGHTDVLHFVVDTFIARKYGRSDEVGSGDRAATPATTGTQLSTGSDAV